MVRFLVRVGVYLVAAAIGLIVADLVLGDMSLDLSSFLIVVAIFALVQALLTPFMVKVTDRNAPALVGGASLISVLVALIITAIVSDGLAVSGLSTWVAAAVIIWLVSMLASFLLPFLLVRMGLQQARERRAET